MKYKVTGYATGYPRRIGSKERESTGGMYDEA